MEIRFTKHALERLTERKIEIEQILLTIKKPDIKTEEINQSAFYKVFEELALKVVIREQDETIKVITVHWLEKDRLKKLKPIIEGEL